MTHAYFPTRLNQICLTNFRTYPSLELYFEKPFLVFTGVNGVGKTNILEAISFFSPGRGLRRARLSEIITRAPSFFKEKEKQREEDPSLKEEVKAYPYAFLGWGVGGYVQTRKGVSHIQTGISLNGISSLIEKKSPQQGLFLEEPEKRQIRIEEKEVSTQIDLERLLTILWITPSQDRLLAEGITVRRKFFDRLVSSLYPDHGTRLYRYEYALKERARLLREGKRDPYWFNTLEQTLAEEGIALIIQRDEFLRMIQEVFKTTLFLTQFPIPSLLLTGDLEKLIKGKSALEAEELFRQKLKENRSIDAEQGGTSLGAHLTDLTVKLQEKNLPIHYCSMGEQKALLLSLLLAHCHIHSLYRKESPLFLLDEGVGHLDESRREELFSILERMHVQTFFTGTDKNIFKDLQDRADFFKVETGKVLQENF